MKRLCKAAILTIALLLLAGCATFLNSPPVANFTAYPETGSAPLTVSFNAFTSQDPDGYITSWEWNFGDGGTATGEKTSHLFAFPSTYTVRLTVMDNRGAINKCYFEVVVTDLSFSSTAEDVWSFITYAQNTWHYEADVDPELCQWPTVSHQLMSGDCDDFAVMIAYYLQEQWGYDTFVAFIDMVNAEDHWVAFVCVSESLKDRLATQCGNSYSYLTWQGRAYIPIDWRICPSWTWVSGGFVDTHEWNELALTYCSVLPSRTEPPLDPGENPVKRPAAIPHQGGS